MIFIERKYKVYIHIFPNNKVYIGITRQTLQQRWGKNGQGYKKQKVYKYIIKFGWDNIEHKLLYDNLTSSEAQKIEIELINKYNSIENGYNEDTGGGLGGDCWCEFNYNGIIYTAKELADMSKYDLSYHDITNRINSHGWSIDKAINTPKGRRNVKFKYNNKLYSIKELYEIRINKDLTLNQIKDRLLNKNWDIERAITQPSNVKKQPKGLGKKIYEYKGKLYNSYELCLMSKIDNLTPFDITNRINHHGWSVEKAITQPKRKK